VPLFEYRCRECEKRFEEFVLGDAKPRCPKCRSAKLEKLLSVFAVSAGGGASAGSTETPGGCGSCGDPRGPGSCGVN
jgi:putative FmdB family regulatory protein